MISNQKSDLTGPARVILEVDTSATATPWPIPPSKVTPPQITLNGKTITPNTLADSPVGYQAVILENQTLTVLLNKYYTLSSSSEGWYNNYVEMYSKMKEDLLGSYCMTANNLLVLASFGLGNNLAPTDDFKKFLKENGAGPQLDYWLTHCDPGSQMSNPNWWMVTPINYILIGNINSVIGLENYQKASDWNGSVQSSLSTFLERWA